MNRMIRDLMIAKASSMIAQADASEGYPVGTTFDFDILGDPRASAAKAVIERVLSKVSLIDLPRLVQYGPFEVVYVAKGAPADLVCKDGEGDHFYLPSGVLALLDKCKGGDFPPPLPEVDEDDESEAQSPEDIIKEALDRITKDAA